MKKLTTLITSSALLCLGAEAALVAHYEFEDTPSLFTDSSAEGNDLTPSSTAPTLGTGVDTWSNGSLAISGGSYAGDADSPMVDLTAGGDYSLSAWIKVASAVVPDTEKVRTILGTKNTNGMLLYLDQNGQARYARYAATEPTITGMASGKIIADNTWMHLAITFDDATDTTSFYVDGILQTSKIVAPNPVLAGQTVGLGVGARHSSGGNLLNDGFIDDVGIWNHTLSATDVLNIKNNGIASIAVPEPTTTSLIGLGALAALNRRRRA